jgi:hypothetical protein
MKKLGAIFFFISITATLPCAFSWADELSVQFSGHSKQEERLESSIAITGAISYDIIDAIRNGITAKLFITFQLSNSSRFIGRTRSTFRERSESFNIYYDVWENGFVLEDNLRKNHHIVRRYDDIIDVMNAAINPLSMNLSGLEHTGQVYMRARIKIQTIRLFPPFGIFLIFFDPWNFESVWSQTEVMLKDM